MPGRVTTVWTEAHSTVAAAAATAALTGFAVIYQPAQMQLPVVGILLVCIVISLCTNGFTGLAVGLVGAASMVGLHRWISTWHSLDFVPTLAAAVLLLGASWTAGASGAQLRDLWRRMATPTDGASGSLGMFTRAAAEERLAEEIGRAWEFARPLAVAMISLRFHDGVQPPDQTAARRAIGRLVESRLSDIDIPFDNLALQGSANRGELDDRDLDRGPEGLGRERDHADAEFGAVLPERSASAAWQAVASIAAAARTATYVVREADTDAPDRRRLLDVATISVGIAALTRSSTASSLIEAARTATKQPMDI
jgi:hypothetical protein